MEKKVRKHNLMFVPSSGEIKQIQLDSKGMRIFLLVLGLFILFNVGLFIYNLSSIPRFVKMERIRHENLELREEIDYMAARLDTSRHRLASLAQMERRIRTMEGLDQISDESGVIGFGGPQLKLTPDEKSEMSVLEFKGAKLSYALDSLIAQAEFQLESYAQLCSTATTKKKILDHTPSISPMKGYISSVFGYRIDPFTGLRKIHEGIDIVAPRGTPIKATADGIVTFAGWYHGYGKLVRINHKYYETRYGHMDRIDVRRGQRVKRGDQIGTCGKTGRTTALHVHYEVRVNGKPVDPEKYILPKHAIVD